MSVYRVYAKTKEEKKYVRLDKPFFSEGGAMKVAEAYEKEGYDVQVKKEKE